MKEQGPENSEAENEGIALLLTTTFGSVLLHFYPCEAVVGARSDVVVAPGSLVPRLTLCKL